MKKINVLILGAVAALAVSCSGGMGNGISPKTSLKTTEDTLAYAYGVEMANKGLEQYLAQLGLIQDTAMLRQSYDYKIGNEQDATKKDALKAEFKTKLDSVSKANTKNKAEFISGLKVALGASAEKAAYFRGVEIGGQINQMSDNVSKAVYGEESKESLDKAAILAGILSVLNKEKSLVDNAEAVFNTKMQEVQETNLKKEFGANLEAGKKFLEENKSKEGVVTLPDGLQYKVVKEGNGPKPVAADRVKVHYHGTLIDGTVFDSSVEKGEPAVFGVSQVIPGWTEALQLMPVGSKWIVYVPQELAYGSRNTGSIKPFSTLVFEVELLSIEK